MSKGGMYRAFKSSDYCGSLVETAASSAHQGQCEENQDEEEHAEYLSKQDEKTVKVKKCHLAVSENGQCGSVKSKCRGWCVHRLLA